MSEAMDLVEELSGLNLSGKKRSKSSEDELVDAMEKKLKFSKTKSKRGRRHRKRNKSIKVLQTYNNLDYGKLKTMRAKERKEAWERYKGGKKQK
jgi:hypothetical protein